MIFLSHARMPRIHCVHMLARRTRRHRSGFTAVEALVAIAIVAIVATVVVPVALSRLNKTDAQQVAAQMNAIAAAVENFHEKVGVFPGSWADLFRAPTTSDIDACGRLYTSDMVAAWGGPYLNAPQVNVTSISDGRTWGGFKFNVTGSGPEGRVQFWLEDTQTSPRELDYQIDSLFDFDGNLNAGYITRNDIVTKGASIHRLFFNMAAGGCGSGPKR
jgi:general secretion pathway protein G